MDLIHDLLFVLAGLATGALSAVFGVGGAVLSQPAIRALGVPALVAISTTLPTILPGAATGTLRYWRAGLIDGRVVAWTVPFGMATSAGGSVLSRVVPGEGHLLTLATAGLLGFTTWRIARTALSPTEPVTEPMAETDAVTGVGGVPRSEAAGLGCPAAKRHLTGAAAAAADGPSQNSPPTMVAIGAGAGLLSGLLGVGGGVVLVPAFTEILRLPLKRGIATSLACVGLFAVPGTITHALLGGVDWKVALLLSAGIVPGAWAGSRLVLVARERRLRLAVAAFLGLLAVVYGVGELLALVY